MCFQHFLVTLFYLKKPLFFLTYFFFVIQFSNNNGEIIKISGGDEESRTPDPLLARQVLSQLSYTPIFCSTIFKRMWWAEVDSNHRPHAYQACALTC